MDSQNQNSYSIAMILLPDEQGHINAFTTFARRLKKKGFNITFIGLIDDKKRIEDQGFSYKTVGQSLFPMGQVKKLKQDNDELFFFTKLINALRLLKDIRNLLLEVGNDIKGCYDLIICDALLQFGVHLASKAEIPIVLLDTSLPFDNPLSPPLHTENTPKLDGTISLFGKFSTTAFGKLCMFRLSELIIDIVGGSLMRLAFGPPSSESKDFNYSIDLLPRRMTDIRGNYPRLIACPKAFDFNTPSLPESIHIDALIEDSNESSQFDWSAVPNNATVVYASMGSQAWLLKNNGKDFYETIIRAFKGKDDHFLIFSAGKLAKALSNSCSLDNVRFLEWAPQKSILKRASVMITHAGLNSVKECIHFEVPMICFPMGRDQPGNSARVKYHRLGLVGSIEKTDSEMISRMLLEIRINPIYKISMRRMKTEFDRALSEDCSVNLIRAALRNKSISSIIS